MQPIQHRVFSILRSSAVLAPALLVTSCISSGVTGTDSSALGSIAAVSGTGQTARAGTTLPKPFVVKVANQFGSGISGVTVTWAIVAGDGTLGQSSGGTDADGTALIVYTAGTMVGISTVTATLTGLPAVIFNVTVTSAVAAAVNPARTSP